MDETILLKIRDSYDRTILQLQTRITYLKACKAEPWHYEQLADLEAYRNQLFIYLKEVNFLLRKIFNKKIKYK